MTMKSNMDEQTTRFRGLACFRYGMLPTAIAIALPIVGCSSELQCWDTSTCLPVSPDGADSDAQLDGGERSQEAGHASS